MFHIVIKKKTIYPTLIVWNTFFTKSWGYIPIIFKLKDLARCGLDKFIKL
jgi:hypothetical protein